MSYIESIIQSLVMFLAVLSPVDGFNPEQQLEKEVYPHVYIVPREELTMAVCGCDCDIGGMYLGKRYVGGEIVHTIIMGGIERNFTFLGQNISVLFPDIPQWKAVLYHELDHQRQFLSYNLEEQYSQYFGDEEVEELLHQIMEEEAYEHQNEFLMVSGLEPIKIDKSVSNSMNWSSGVNTCSPGVTPIPEDKRFNLLDLIEFYDEGMIKIYTEKYH